MHTKTGQCSSAIAKADDSISTGQSSQLHLALPISDFLADGRGVGVGSASGSRIDKELAASAQLQLRKADLHHDGILRV